MKRLMIAFRTNRLMIALGAVAALSALMTMPVQAQIFPLEPNMAVATCDPRPAPAGTDFNLGIIDIRDPICNAPGFPTGFDTGDIENWFAPMYHNEMPNPTNNAADEWTEANLGSIFGVELDNANNPNIYTTSTSVYRGWTGSGAGFGGTGRVMKINGTTGEISVPPFATLPNTVGVGLGNIAFNFTADVFYVTNLDDGRIYVLDSTGATQSVYDPFFPDDGLDGLAPLDERIWGIQYYAAEDRVYFGTWSEHDGSENVPNGVFSVGTDGAGDLVGPDLLEVTTDDLGASSACDYTMPISDISFSASGQMLISERGMRGSPGNFTSTAPHFARELEYAGGTGAWAISGIGFEVGRLEFSCGRTNSAGGGDFTDCVEVDECNAGPLAVFTTDALDCCSAPNNIYGLQIMPATGGNMLDSWGVDLDGDTNDQDKTNLGDVEVVRTCIDIPPGGGCTLTQGFWKNHNRFREKPSQQEPWPINEDTLLCGETWLDNLNTPPIGGDAFYILSHQWIAARLNVAAGADPSAVSAELAEAEDLLNDCMSPDPAQAIELAGILDDYNNGIIGPGHCDDDDDD